jgi:NAD+ kinase
MAKSSLPRLVVFGDTKKEHVASAIKEFTDFVRGKAEIIFDFQSSTENRKLTMDFTVVFGGDGTIISAARQLRQCDAPIIGVNLGKLGFLAEFSIDEVKKYFDDIVSGKVDVEKRMMLGCRVLSGGKEKFNSTAVNDVFITAGPPFRMIEMKMSVDGQSIAGCVSDGLIISTPTGSTAYNLSAGGPILSGKMEAMVITPVCPHSLSFRPIVVDADSKVEIAGVRVNEGTTLSIDGQISCKLSIDDVVKVEREKNDFLIVNNPGRTGWETLATKLSWAGKPKYKVNRDIEL